MSKVDLIVGMQWGSEGKGKLAALLAPCYDIAVRVGGPNAGHTFYLGNEKFVCRSIPCGWINHNCELIIGAGAIVDLTQLAAEVVEFEQRAKIPVGNRIILDRNAVWITPADVADEQDALRHISSTLHGIGWAQRRKIARRSGTGTTIGQLAGGQNQLPVAGQYFRVADTAALLAKAVAAGAQIVVEGTQGALLSLDHGAYPYVTSRNVLAASLLSDVGLSPRVVRNVFGVMRTYPIRVGGPSGPMGLELSWAELARRAGLPPNLTETTTVTGKTRRVADLDYRLLKQAADLNGPTGLYVTFCDYLDGRLREQHQIDYDGRMDRFEGAWPNIQARLASYAVTTHAPVVGVSWGSGRDQGVHDSVYRAMDVTTAIDPEVRA